MSARRTSPCLVLPAMVAAVLFLVPMHAAHAREGTTVAQVVKQLDTSLKQKETKAVTTGLESVITAHKTAEKKDRAPHTRTSQPTRPARRPGSPAIDANRTPSPCTGL